MLNKILFIKVILISWLITIETTDTLAAAGFGCDGVAGAVIFKDTLYGGATGILISGLVVVAQDDRTDSAKTIANGGLVGTVLGLGLGVLEITTRDCHQPSRRGQQSSQGQPIFAYHNKRLTVGFKMTID